MELKPIGYAAAQSLALGAAGFAAGFCTHVLVKSAITRVALGAMGAAILGGAAAVQYAVRQWCDLKIDAISRSLYTQSIALEIYYVAVCATFVALGALSTPHALITLGLSSLYPLAIALLIHKTQKNDTLYDALIKENCPLPERLFHFPVVHQLLQMLPIIR